MHISMILGRHSLLTSPNYCKFSILNFLSSSAVHHLSRVHTQQQNEQKISLSQSHKGKTYNYEIRPTSLSFSLEDNTKYLQPILQSSFSPYIPPFIFQNKTCRQLISLYLPQDFPSSVTSNYLPYTLRSNLGMIFGSANGVLATQSLLHAMGMGFATALPLSAGINWILKDGCGQLLAIYFASNISKGFDANVKKWRMNSAIFYELSILMECLTPIVCSLLPVNVKPVAFLFCASIANAGKNICWMSTSASKAHIHKYMCMNDNMADITAKSVSQAIVCSLSGTMLGICLSLLNIIGHPSIFLVYCCLTTGHLLSVHRSLAFIHDPLLNEMRARTLAKQFIESKGEGLLVMPSEIDDKIKHRNAIVINERISDCSIFKKSPHILLDIIQRFRDETSLKYWMYWNSGQLYVWFTTDASSVNVLHCMLCATHFLNGVLGNSERLNDENISKSIIYANENCENWVECLQKSGWNIENLFIELEKDRIACE